MAAGRAPHKIPESVLVVIHTPEREVLLIERADAPGFWQSVTGSKDVFDEPLEQTCIREVEEETGIRVAGATGSSPTSTRSTRAGATATSRACCTTPSTCSA